jgi:hypothetical protein
MPDEEDVGVRIPANRGEPIAEPSAIVRPPHESLTARRYTARVAPAVVLAAAVLGIAASDGFSEPTASASRVTDADRRLQMDRRPRPRAGRVRSRKSSRRPLEFGIYPGGAAGTVGPAGKVRPEVAKLRLEALRTLRGGARPFVVHLYDAYTEPADRDALPDWLASQIATYTADGFKVELVLTYRPRRATGDVAGFAAFVRARVRQLGGNPDVKYLQVTNEANVSGAPDAADGAYRGARAAVVRGVIAARDEARSRGFDDLRIGFNWAYQLGRAERTFFASLGRRGGRRFATAVDWVGLDSFPGTWGPALGSGDLGSGVRTATLAAIRLLREDLLPRARLAAADLHVSESGYPTGPGRTEAMQEEALRAAVRAVAETAAEYRVTGYRWFNLRDADSASPSFESQYGLMRDDYSPKPAFLAYRDLIKAFH